MSDIEVGLSDLARYIEEKIDCKSIGLDACHILPVLKILVEEMIVEVKKDGLDILGLGRFEIRQLKDHGHNDVNNVGRWVVSKGLKKVRMMLGEDLKGILLEHLSRRRTFPPRIEP